MISTHTTLALMKTTPTRTRTPIIGIGSTDTTHVKMKLPNLVTASTNACTTTTTQRPGPISSTLIASAANGENLQFAAVSVICAQITAPFGHAPNKFDYDPNNGTIGLPMSHPTRTVPIALSPVTSVPTPRRPRTYNTDSLETIYIDPS